MGGGRTIDPTPLDPHMADVYRITCFFFLCYHTIRIPRIDNMTYVRTHLRKRKKKNKITVYFVLATASISMGFFHHMHLLFF